MRFGICTSADNAATVKAAGWDYVEENVQTRLQGLASDTDWAGPDAVTKAAAPVLAANCLVPGDVKIVGPVADPEKLKSYMTNVLKRAAVTGIRTLVFGSGGARNIPEGFERDIARLQILDFLRMSAPIAQQNGITIVIEPLNKKECNIINGVGEAMTYVREVKHPNIQCLVDTWHLWLENEPLANLVDAMPNIRHVHLADTEGRVAPGQSGKADYRPVFKVLKGGNYNGLVSVEASFVPDLESTAKTVLAFVKKQWAEA